MSGLLDGGYMIEIIGKVLEFETLTLGSIYSNLLMFAKDLSNKICSPLRHQDTKFNYNKHLLFVSWCLCGYSFRLVRVGYQ